MSGPGPVRPVDVGFLSPADSEIMTPIIVGFGREDTLSLLAEFLAFAEEASQLPKS